MKIDFAKLEKIRKERRLTQSEMAHKLNCKQPVYSNWESGLRNPGLKAVLKISSILNINPLEISLEEIPGNLNISDFPPEIQEYLQLYNSLNSETKRNLAKEMFQKLLNDIDLLKKLGC